MLEEAIEELVPGDGVLLRVEGHFAVEQGDGVDASLTVELAQLFVDDKLGTGDSVFKGNLVVRVSTLPEPCGEEVKSYSRFLDCSLDICRLRFLPRGKDVTLKHYSVCILCI